VNAGERVRSIDLVRGADVLLMLFVNELAGVPGAPAFLHHAPLAADAMTLADVVFPAFLFVVGLAIPFALGRRLQRGSAAQAGRHVLARSLALLVTGVLMAAGERGVAGLLATQAWNVCMTIGVLLTWGVPEAGWRRLPRAWLRGLGAALLLFVAATYRAADGSGWTALSPDAWGVLGLIAWSYAVAAGLYLVVRERPAALAGLVVLFSALALAEGLGLLPAALRSWLRLLLGTHTAIVLSGVLLGVWLGRWLRETQPLRPFLLRTLALVASLALAGGLLHLASGRHPAFALSKLQASLPWGLLCAALTAFAWLLVFLAADAAGLRHWPASLTIAGQNPLLAYLLAPALLASFELSAPLFGGANPYESVGGSTAVELVRSALFAWLVVRSAGLLRRCGVRLQL